MKQGSGGSASANPMVTLPTVNAQKEAEQMPTPWWSFALQVSYPQRERTAIMATRIPVRSGEMNRPPDTGSSNAAVPPDAEGAPTWKPPTLPRKLPPDPVLALKDRAKAARQEAEKMREAAIKALRDHGVKGC
jgi:hypothetical protein